MPLLLAAFVGSLVLACERVPTAPPSRAAVPNAPTFDLDPEYTGDPNDGCWIAPDSAVFGGSPTFGGIYPYDFVRCGVYMDVWWPGYSNGVDWPLTTVYNGNGVYSFPWGHEPWTSFGFPWTITFGKAVRNVRVYTRKVTHAGAWLG